MSYQEILQTTLIYIDEHLDQPLTLEVLAEIAGFSPYHFSRVFRWGVGYSVMSYIRHRRLSFAASRLSSREKIIDIALESGFDTHSGFSKAFRRQYGCSPETYRMHANTRLPTLPVLTTIETYLLGGIIMEPKFITKPNIHLAGYTITTSDNNGQNNMEISAFWKSYLTDSRMEKLHSETFGNTHAEYGACLPMDNEIGTFNYIIGVEYKEHMEIAEEYQTATLPAATYAVFSSVSNTRDEFSKNIRGTWNYIFNEWFSTSGYEFMDGGTDFEYYDERSMGETNLVCDIYIPVTKAL